MSVRINIPHDWRHLTNDQAIVKVHGDAVGQCLGDLVRQFPKIRQGLFDKNGKLHNYVDIYVNLESSHPEELAKPVAKGDELHITLAIAGDEAKGRPSREVLKNNRTKGSFFQRPGAGGCGESVY